MTLTNRLSMFFLAALALVLAGFSITLYVLARAHLHAQATDRLEGALTALIAAVEISGEGLEWEPGERRLALGPGGSAGQLVWLISDSRGQIVDESVRADESDFLLEAAGHLQAEQRLGKRLDWQGGRWQFRQQWLQADPGAPVQASEHSSGRRYSALAITAGLSLEPLRATLRRLACILIGLSLGIWVTALLVGRFLCRQALRPLRQMADCATSMDASDLGRRLPTERTADEVEDLGRAFNGLLDRLQESFERQRRFSGDASHQLRTPLTAMLGQVEVALRRERPAPEYQEVLRCVQQQASRLRRIVESLLFLSRADADASLPDRERIDLAPWFTAHLQSWKEHPRRPDMAVIVQEPTPAWVDVHAGLLGEVVDILLDNACKYSPPERPIRIRLQRFGERIELSVQDEGCGIADSDLGQLFRPFFRSADARRRGVEGMGLGLAIAKRIADVLGATLRVSSAVGRGSCFTLRLPAAGE